MQAEADTPHPCNYLVYGRRVAGSTGHLASLDREAIKGRETYKGSTLFGTAKAVPFRSIRTGCFAVGQFSVGIRSTWSMTRTSKGAFCGSSLRPSCSWIAVKRSGRLESGKRAVA